MGRKRKAVEALDISARDVLQDWNEYYSNTDFGIGIQCSLCQKWRLTYQYQESKEVPTEWNCSMWKISKKKRGNCSMPSKLTEADFVPEDYAPGTVVWAKLRGFPCWPAMVEDCPDTQSFFMTLENGEEAYHVTFFGASSKRSWVKSSDIREFDNPPTTANKASKPSLSLKKSIDQAKEAAKLPIKERLIKYSFAVRYKGRWWNLKQKDEILLPPATSKQKGLPKHAEDKLPATKENRSTNRNDHPKPVRRRRKRAPRYKKKVQRKKREMIDVHHSNACPSDNSTKSGKLVEMIDDGHSNVFESDNSTKSGKLVEMIDDDHSNACPNDNSVKTGKLVDKMKQKPVDQNHQNSPEDCRVERAETTVIIRKDVVGQLKSYHSYQVHKYHRRYNSAKSTASGTGNVVNRSEETGTSTDIKDKEGNETGNLSIPSSLADSHDSVITISSSDDEVEEETPYEKAYRKFITKKYPSFISQFLSGSAERQMVAKS